MGTSAPARTRLAVSVVAVLGVLLAAATLFFGGITFITQVIANGSGVVVGLVIVVRGSSAEARRMGWLVALAFLGIGIGTMSVVSEWLLNRGHDGAAAWATVIAGSADAEFGMGILTVAALVPILFLAVAFPNGRIAPGWRWYPWAVAVAATSLAVGAVFSPLYVGDVELTHPLFAGVVSDSWTSLAEMSLLGAALLQLVSVFSLVGRYRTAGTTATARQQIKWFGFGLGVYMVTIVSLLVGEMIHTISYEVFVVVDGLMFTLIPLSLGVAILRYRLYDIDRIISRTLAYALTFALLTGLFVLIATGPVLVAGSGAESFPPLLVSISTLVVAALFNPVRHRLLRSLERRFDRAHYDAELVIERFSESVTDLTDLDAVEAQLTDVLTRTLAPTSVAIWISGGDS